MTPRQRATWCAHVWKALTRQHHGEMEDIFRAHIPPHGTVIDVGAHAGQFTKLFARMCPQGHVHAFEPGSYALSVLRTVRTVRRLSNVVVHPVALGDARGTATLVSPIKESGSVGFGLSFIGNPDATPRRTATETVRVRRLDDVVEECAMRRVDFIKVDIEGSEQRMLAGAERTLLRFRPAIYAEVVDWTLARRGDSREALTRYLRDLGYAPDGGWHDRRQDGNVLFVNDRRADKGIG